MKTFLFVLLVIGPYCSFAQQFNCDNTEIEEAYNLAVKTVDINVRRGILAAGGDYGGEWTRDIAINSWNGVSLLRPAIAERSLWSVTINRDTIGHQYWDKIIWVIAAYNHYQLTGNKEFLKQAYLCAVNTMNAMEDHYFDTQYGLFKGASVFNDGIAGYEEPVYDSQVRSTLVLDFKNAANIKCLSTNCVYYGAYLALAQMSAALNKDKTTSQRFITAADRLKSNILKYLYNSNENKFYYLINYDGSVDKSQEALGLSFATIFGIIEKQPAYTLTRDAHVSRFGITSIYPDFKRYSPEKPGRHNNIIWPMVNGFYAKASLIAGNRASFTNELNSLTHLALDEDKGDYNFREIYNPYTGVPDGGWQRMGDDISYHWTSCKLQTWSATAYINMVNEGLLGLHFENDSLKFSPFLPATIHSVAIKNLQYRKADLDIKVTGNGFKIKSFLLNGKAQTVYAIPASLKGLNKISIELE